MKNHHITLKEDNNINLIKKEVWKDSKEWTEDLKIKIFLLLHLLYLLNNNNNNFIINLETMVIVN